MTKDKIKANVSKRKIETVKGIVGLINNNSTIIIASIKNLPSKQFQNIRKSLRDKAEILVVKKRIMLKSIEESGNKKIEELKKFVVEDSAVLFSKEDPFELSGILAKNKKPIGAKPGQIAPEDIKVEEGTTDIMPGPAISEFGALGIPIAVQEGKIAIKQSKVIVKAGEEINEAAASIMSKLEIKPFKIGLDPIVLCEVNTGKIYKNIKIDTEKAVQDLKIMAGKALGLAQKIAYYCKETIGYLLCKANSHAASLNKLQPKEEKKEENAQSTEENKSQESGGQ